MNQKKMLAYFISLTLIIVFPFYFLSCNILSEPEPFDNKAISSQRTKYLNATLANYQYDQVVSGNIVLKLVVDWYPNSIDSIVGYIDSKRIVPLNLTKINDTVTYDININTKTWPDGKHEILFYVYKKLSYDDSLGILGLLNAPTHIYKTSLTFDKNSLPLTTIAKSFIDNLYNTVFFIEEHYNGWKDIEVFSTINCELLDDDYITLKGTYSVCRSLSESQFFILIHDLINGDHIVRIYYLPTGYIVSITKFKSNVPLDNITACAAGDKDNIFYSDSFGNLNISSYQGVLISTARLFDGPARYLSISPDSSKMLAVDNSGVKSYLITDKSADILIQSLITDRIDLFYSDWKNSRIFVARKNTLLELWDIETLNLTASYELPETIKGAANITAIRANKKYLYAAYTIKEGNNDSSIVVEYDIATKTMTRSWSYTYMIQSLAGSENGRYLFAGSSFHQWIIDLGGLP